MKVGDRLFMVPTIDTSAFLEKSGPRRCWVVSVNERHRHFTVQFDLPGGCFRECYKMEEAQT